MALREIRIDGDEILRKISKPVAVVDEKINMLIDDMLETMYNVGGVGLAAVQIGVLRRIFVMDDSENGDSPIILINPEIISVKGEQEGQEACLSVPGYAGEVLRPKVVDVKYLNRDGIEVQSRFEDRQCVIFHHELDHLDGILYTDRASEVYEMQREEE
ncbi:MAG: peptide deformylase [Defluviitaleaceae bacterium]|nr:peptide deformylase [Defluviitaleaceae bacterium]